MSFNKVVQIKISHPYCVLWEYFKVLPYNPQDIIQQLKTNINNNNHCSKIAENSEL